MCCESGLRPGSHDKMVSSRREKNVIPRFSRWRYKCFVVWLQLGACSTQGEVSHANLALQILWERLNNDYSSSKVAVISRSGEVILLSDYC